MLVASRWAWAGYFAHFASETTFKISPPIPAPSMLIRAEFGFTSSGTFNLELGAVITSGERANVAEFISGRSIFDDNDRQLDGHVSILVNLSTSARAAYVPFDLAVPILSTPARLLVRSSGNANRTGMSFSFLCVPLETIPGQPGSGVFDNGANDQHDEAEAVARPLRGPVGE